MSEYPKGFERSRAILIGVEDYASPKLPNLPGIGGAAADLASALTRPGVGFLAAPHVQTMLDPQVPAQVLSAVRQAADDAHDVLFVYFAGHGSVDSSGDLNLMLKDSRPDRSHFTALQFNYLREIVQSSPARHKIIVLDCCYTGRIQGGHSQADLPAVESAEIPGSYVISSAFHYDSGTTSQTYFTRALLDTLHEGIPGGPAYLTLDSLLNAVRRELSSMGMPDVSLQRSSGEGALVLTRNAAYVDGGRDRIAEIPSVRELFESFPEFGQSELSAFSGDYESFPVLQDVNFDGKDSSSDDLPPQIGCVPETETVGSPGGRREWSRRTKLRRFFLAFVEGMARSFSVGFSLKTRRSPHATAWERIDAELRRAYDQLGTPPSNNQDRGPGATEGSAQ